MVRRMKSALRALALIGSTCIMIAAYVVIGGGVAANGATHAVRFTKSTVEIGAINGATGPAFPTPEQFAGEEAAVKAINAAGGAGGHQLKLVTCDQQQNGTASAACWQKITSNSSIVAETGADPFDINSENLINASGLALVGNYAITDLDFSSPLVFLESGASGTLYVGAADYAISHGLKNVSIMETDLPTITPLQDGLEAVINAGGGKVQSVVKVALTTTDMTADAAQASLGNPQAILMIIGESQQTSAVKALRESGYTGPVIFGGDQYTNQYLQQLGVTTSGLVGVTSMDPVMVSNAAAEVKEHIAQMKKYEPKSVIDGLSLVAWAGVNLIAEAVSTMSTVTRSSLLAKLNSMNAVHTGLTPVLNFTKAGSTPGLPRVVNTYVAYIVAKGAKWTWNGKLESVGGLPAISGLNLGTPPQT